MRRSLVAICVLAAAGIALAQTGPFRTPAGEPPLHVRNRRAAIIGRFNPQQMLRLAFGLRPPHLEEEEQFLQELMTPGSPQFHKFLTADEWNARFAPSAEDEQAVVDWAASQGLRITHRFPNRLIVDVEAPVATIEKALQVRFNNYSLDGETYFSNEREPAIPAELANVIRSVGGLNNFPQMRPSSVLGKIPPAPAYIPGPVVGFGHSDRADGNAAVVEQARSKSRQNDAPNITGGAYDPSDIYTSNIYNYDALKNQGHCCNPNHVPGGSPPESSIALATFGNLRVTNGVFTDVKGFQTQYPYLAYNVTTITVDGGPSACTVGPNQPCANDGETALDVEWSTATSNSFGASSDTAHVYVYEAGGSAENMYNQMLTDGHALIFSTSWSCTEGSGCSNSQMDSRHAIFNQMVGQGWTLMTASGDRGATDNCSAINVSYPASDPDVIGVGGTAIQLFNNGTFSNEVAWTGGTSAKSCTNNNGGSGGGCSAHFSAPSFQSNQPCGSGSRAVPDISLNAAVGQNYFFNGSLGGVGGTSISSPMLAGFFAQEGAYLVYLAGITGNNCGSPHQSCTKMGNGNTYLYKFGLNPSYAPHYPFYDITSGCNSNDITASKNLTAFCSGIGYDRVTGWGTANMLQLAWAINTFIGGDFAAPGVSFTGPQLNHYFNTPQLVNWTVADGSSNGAVPIGVAGFSQGWDALQPDSTSKATPGANDSFYSGPQFPNATAGFLALNNTVEGCHTAHVRTWDNGGSTSDHTFGPVCFDDIKPVINCAAPDGLWHATDVVLHCSASDSLSGLANPADASFNLSTSVPAGTETATAFTNSRVIFDVATNSATAGPLGPNKVDKKPPVILIVQPMAALYSHGTALTLNYTITDGGSGVGLVTATMNGSTTVGGNPLTSGQAISFLSLPLGTNTFAITASDNVGNTSSASVTFTIIATFQDTINDIKSLLQQFLIDDPNLANALIQEILAAQNATGFARINILNQFLSDVASLAGKHLFGKAAQVLQDDANSLWTFQTAAARPLANAGPNQTVAKGSTVTLDGSQSTNQNMVGPLTYSWTFTSRPAGSAAVLTSPASVNPTFVADVAGTYIITLKLNNGVDVSFASVTITAF